MKNQTSYQVEQIAPSGRPIGAISGMGRNRGTWDTTTSSRRTAQRWARQLRAEYPQARFIVETTN